MPSKGTVPVTRVEGDSGRRTPLNMNLVRTRSPQFTTVYANSANVAVSFFDLKIAFGSVEHADASENALHVQDSVAVVMSPEHAKAFLALLSQHVELYEKTFGAIRETPQANEPIA